uniref:SVIL n=1 Tax=Neolamprologus brichardi TaxID=32507 RepID=A0A3Q4HY15_NEOBR
MENAVLEPRSERIARYKAERRRELAERYGSIDELPSKWVRRDEKKDVKTDDRAKMSVAAKMSLFKELEKSSASEASAFLKPRSGCVSHERRSRRGNDHRFLTQPITCGEIVAIPKPAPPVE